MARGEITTPAGFTLPLPDRIREDGVWCYDLRDDGAEFAKAFHRNLVPLYGGRVAWRSDVASDTTFVAEVGICCPITGDRYVGKSSEPSKAQKPRCPVSGRGSS